jgi:hypothetical protein
MLTLFRDQQSYEKIRQSTHNSYSKALRESTADLSLEQHPNRVHKLAEINVSGCPTFLAGYTSYPWSPLPSCGTSLGKTVKNIIVDHARTEIEFLNGILIELSGHKPSLFRLEFLSGFLPSFFRSTNAIREQT